MFRITASSAVRPVFAARSFALSPARLSVKDTITNAAKSATESAKLAASTTADAAGKGAQNVADSGVLDNTAESSSPTLHPGQNDPHGGRKIDDEIRKKGGEPLERFDPGAATSGGKNER